MTLRVLPEALVEIDETIAYYEEQQPGLGIAFFLEIEATLALATEMPGVGAPVHEAPEGQPIRKYVVHRFPFVVWVSDDGDDRVVVAVAHTRRRPGYWRHRVT